MIRLFAVLTLVLPCVASTITYDPGRPSLIQSVDLNIDGSDRSIRAGQIPVLLDATTPLLLYCADPFTFLRFDPVTVNLVPPGNSPQAGRAAWAVVTYAGAVTTSAAASALQMAIWDFVADNGDGFSQGRIRSNGATDQALVSSAAAIVALGNSQSVYPAATFYVPEQGSSYSQTLIGASVIETPEPNAYALIGAGLLALAYFRRPAKARR